MPIALIVHGGAGKSAPERHALLQAGCEEASRIGWQILLSGGSALDAVEAAVRALEDNPEFNAGTGAVLTDEGHIELDAGIMRGHTLSVGAVAGVELIKNPISLARKVMESTHVLLVGAGAQQFARENGIPLCTFEDLLTERRYHIWQESRAERDEPTVPGEPRYLRREFRSTTAREEHGHGHLRLPEDFHEEGKHGTVGAVALDMEGHLAAATSTGGISNKYPGRVGDSPLVGCGFYADENAAISCTGEGEDFVRLLIAKRAADYVERGSSAREAAEAAIAVLGARAQGLGGLIIVDRLGGIGFAHNSPQMSYAYMSEGLEAPVSGIE